MQLYGYCTVSTWRCMSRWLAPYFCHLLPLSISGVLFPSNDIRWRRCIFEYRQIIESLILTRHVSRTCMCTASWVTNTYRPAGWWIFCSNLLRRCPHTALVVTAAFMPLLIQTGGLTGQDIVFGTCHGHIPVRYTGIMIWYRVWLCWLARYNPKQNAFALYSFFNMR